MHRVIVVAHLPIRIRWQLLWQTAMARKLNVHQKILWPTLQVSPRTRLDPDRKRSTYHILLSTTAISDQVMHKARLCVRQGLTTTRNRQKKTTTAFPQRMAPAWPDDLLQTLRPDIRSRHHADLPHLLPPQLTSRQLVAAPEHLRYASAARISKSSPFTSTPQHQKRMPTKQLDKHFLASEITVV